MIFNMSTEEYWLDSFKNSVEKTIQKEDRSVSQEFALFKKDRGYIQQQGSLILYGDLETAEVFPSWEEAYRAACYYAETTDSRTYYNAIVEVYVYADGMRLPASPGNDQGYLNVKDFSQEIKRREENTRLKREATRERNYVCPLCKKEQQHTSSHDRAIYDKCKYCNFWMLYPVETHPKLLAEEVKTAYIIPYHFDQNCGHYQRWKEFKKYVASLPGYPDKPQYCGQEIFSKISDTSMSTLEVYSESTESKLLVTELGHINGFWLEKYLWIGIVLTYDPEVKAKLEELTSNLPTYDFKSVGIRYDSVQYYSKKKKETLIELGLALAEHIGESKTFKVKQDVLDYLAEWGMIYSKKKY